MQTNEAIIEQDARAECELQHAIDCFAHGKAVTLTFTLVEVMVLTAAIESYRVSGQIGQEVSRLCQRFEAVIGWPT
jgi:hypothetical protein